MRPFPALEVCIASIDDALTAETGGADRLELNSALELGGLTPSAGLFDEVRTSVPLPIVAMVRPRAGDFFFSPADQRVMLRDAARLIDRGAGGLACGALTSERTIDREFWRQLVAVARGREIVFHRAFDDVADQAATLESLIELGTTRVLTSGGAPTALAGAAQLARLVQQAAGRIEILPAAGIAAQHVVELLRATGCRQIHGSFRELEASPPRTSRERVAAARAALDARQSP